MLSSLQDLNLGNNQLTSLPPEIGDLSSLQIFNFNNNQLTSLPPEIGDLSSLQDIYLNNNQLTSLPPEIGDLSNLRDLELYRNQLTSLPPEIIMLSSLQNFNLTNNQLTSLPSEIGNLSSLEGLYLGGNQLTSLPSEIGDLSHLYILYLSGNSLRDLLQSITNLSLNIFGFSDTDICAWGNEQELQGWLESIDDLTGSNITCVTTNIPLSGDVFAVEDNSIIYTFPENSFATDVTLRHHPLFHSLPNIDNLAFAKGLETTAVDNETNQPVQPINPYSISIDYGYGDGETVAMYRWEDDGWVLLPDAAVDIEQNRISATLDQLSILAVTKEKTNTYLPIIMEAESPLGRVKSEY